MARPGPNIISTYELPTESVDIINPLGYWVITYCGEPITLRRRVLTVAGTILKYPKCVFPEAASAKNAARKLNRQFKCRDFGTYNLMAPMTLNIKTGVN